MRHACQACGRSCQGVRVPLVDAREVRLVIRLGQRLGLDEVVDGPFLATRQGRCPFQAPDGRCRIHTEVSFEAKPRACRQYPVVAARTEAGPRLGVDPGCFTAIRTWRQGPTLPEEGWAEQPAAAWYEEQGADEGAVLAELSTLSSLQELLPSGLPERLLVLLQASDLHASLDDPTNGQALAELLGPVLSQLLTWTSAPPWPPLPPEAEAWALEATRRMVWLRLVPDLPSAELLALWMAMGALVSAWGGTEVAGFGARLAAWTRLVRSARFRRRLVPSAESLVWLVEG